MNDEDFCILIDSNFPYDYDGATKLIKKGCDLSPNAAFMIAHEIARPPRSAGVDKRRRIELLDIWTKHFVHELKEPIAEACRMIIDAKPLSPLELRELVYHLKRFPGESCALNIVYFAAPNDLADEVYREVSDAWRVAGKGA